MNDSEYDLLTTRTGIRGNVRAITITDNKPEHFNSLISIAKANYSFSAWIIHDKDSGVEPHIHLLCVDKGGTTIKAHCERFASVIPANFVCKVKSVPAVARYLIHQGFPNKYQYDISEVQSNNIERYHSLIQDCATDSKTVWHAFVDVKMGKMSPEDFISAFPAEFSSMPFYQKVSLFNKLYSTFYER